MMQVDEIIGILCEQLKSARTPDGMWRGRLSSSAISTSVSVFALYSVDKEKYSSHIEKGVVWLKNTMQADGSWGDSIESPSNMTATLLTYASLCAVSTPPQETKEYLAEKFGGSTDRHIIDGVLTYYGKDLTFSAPILVMCALAGVISDWDKIPQLPFEVSVLPQRLFRFFQLPVVSYAIPALIAVGILLYKKGRKNIFSPLRKAFINKSLKVLVKLQPENGGFLEAAPLTAFVTMCMCGAGYRNHIATQKAAGFLVDTVRKDEHQEYDEINETSAAPSVNTVREDGSWPIDTDLASWVTSLSVRALEENLTYEEKQSLASIIRKNAFKYKHPFTGAKEGGWGWTNLSGAAPDADDTAGALVALHILLDGRYCDEVGKGIEWLINLQNNDGGMPTFCKGWGKLPFDRSSPDISAHTILAFNLWKDALPTDLKAKCERSIVRLHKWMHKIQAPDGSWTPLWFGDQDAKDERSPIYGTAMTVEYLAASNHHLAKDMIEKGLNYILSVQNDDGGWGGTKNVPSKVTLTARALSALCSTPDDKQVITTDNESPSSDKQIGAAVKAYDFLCRKFKAGELLQKEPIGLYFARLWYSEELYNITFVLNALNKFKKYNRNTN